MAPNAILVLEDGTVFKGRSIGACGQSVGEVVFNTAITGYQEILTDPSYARQLITLTYPHIGNVGCNEQDCEADNIHAAGLIIRACAKRVSNWRNEESLPAFLKRRNVVAISDIDTRKLTRLIRAKGAQNGCIKTVDNDLNLADGAEIDKALQAARNFAGLKGMDLARVVSSATQYQWHEGSWHEGGFCAPPATKFNIVAYDFGIKRNILRMLADKGCSVTIVPATTTAADALRLRPDGIFLSNGPGDPEPCDYAIEAIRQLIATNIPIFGICLGHQLLALALGGKTKKMKTGHHGANHPVQELSTGQVLITSQNHGFTVDENSLPETIRITHKSLFDGTLQGIECTDTPAFSFQGHPEASPGPHDIGNLFDHFVELMQTDVRKAAKPAA